MDLSVAYIDSYEAGITGLHAIYPAPAAPQGYNPHVLVAASAAAPVMSVPVAVHAAQPHEPPEEIPYTGRVRYSRALSLSVVCWSVASSHSHLILYDLGGRERGRRKGPGRGDR